MKIKRTTMKQCTKTGFLSMLLILCIAHGFATAEAQKAPKPTLYKVDRIIDNHVCVPYYLKINGDKVGRLLVNGVYEVVAIEGDWAKIKYKGGEYYISKKAVKKVDAPDIVCSAWARDWMSYDGIYRGLAGEWSGVADDWTKPITRADMADMLVNNIMTSVYGAWAVQYTLPRAIKSNGGYFFTDTKEYEPGRLANWGVVSTGKFNPTGSITYSEFTALLVKLMAYDKKYVREGGGGEFTLADIAKFAIGGDKGPKAKCTKEQAMVLCDKALRWRQEMAFLTEVKHEKASAENGVGSVYNGIYTIKTMLGQKPNQPHLFVNAGGQVVLNSAKKQQFKITYKKSTLNIDRDVIFLYTIQTMDGKYLATSGTPDNGSRLIAQKNEYLWEIEYGNSEDEQCTNFIEDPNNYFQVVNVAAWKLDNGTPIITWFWNHGTGADSNNCKFIFSKVS